MSSIIDDLQNPACLPDNTEMVLVVQTHISIVFVADEWVYKVKKPVDFGFLDFLTLEKRKFYCYQELQLNRRLAKDIYVDVLPITYDGKMYSMKGGQGKTVEYAVKMKRVPDEKLMKSLFRKKLLTDAHLKVIAEMLAGFHSTALRTAEIDRFGEPERFRINTDENFEQVEKYIGKSIRENEFSFLKRWTDDFYKANTRFFHKRIKEGRVRDCHGDLHMEHVCFTDPPAIIDCIEFNDRFRYSDAVADMAFLLMDLEYHGGNDEAKRLWRYYRELSRDEEVGELLNFYKVYRAFVRGKVNSFQLDDDEIGPDKKEAAVQSARKYFQLAYSYIG